MIDDQKAIETLKNTEKQGETTASKLGDIAKKGVMVGTAVAAGVATAAGALVGMVTKTSETADRIDKLSAKTGLSKQAFQEWDYVLGQNGIEIEKMQTGMKTLTANMDAAASGNENMAGAFDALGVSVTNADGTLRNQEETMNDVILKLADMPNGTEKARLATELFGKAGVELMPMLNNGAEGIEQLKERSHELGLVMSDEAVNAGVVFGDTLDDVKDSLGMVVTKVGSEVMPIVQKMLDWVLANMPTIQSVASKVFEVIGQVVTGAADIFNNTLMPVFNLVFDWVQANMPMMQEVMKVVFENVKSIWEETLRPVFDALLGVLETVWNVFQAAWPSIQQVMGIAFEAMKLAWELLLKPAIDALVEIVNFLKVKFDENMPAIQGIFQAMAQTIQWAWESYLKPAFEAIGAILSWVYDAFQTYILPIVGMVIDWFGQIASGIGDRMKVAQGEVDAAVQGIIGFFGGLKQKKDDVVSWFEEIRRGISDKINAARDAVNTAVEAIKGFFNFTFSWPSIPMPSFAITPSGWKIGDLLKGSIPDLSIAWNADGGIFTRPTIFDTANGLQGVGEAGPEAILPISKLPELLGLDKQQQPIDYDRLAAVIVTAISKLDLRIEMDRRQFGRLVMEFYEV
ncbi:MAG: hypothetical protein EOM48_05040 [Bacilli bacterium]|nr:hypothetical protein [Bacilli bacterium]